MKYLKAVGSFQLFVLAEVEISYDSGLLLHSQRSLSL